MSQSTHPISQPAAEEALRWFLRLRAPGCSDDDRRTFEQWLAADGGHQAEFAAVLETWTSLSLVAAKPAPELERCVAQALAIRAPQAGGARQRRPWGRWLGRMAAVAAAIVLMSGTLWWWLFVKVTVADYRTTRGQQQTVTLADGTVMELNTDSAVIVRMWGRGRQVVMESGEAYFTVAHDPRRPFEVVAANGQIHDIGTQFSVYRQPDRVLVEVESGAVRIDLPADGIDSSNGHVVRPGERAMYMSGGQWVRLDQIKPNQVAVWREGQLRFDGIPLADAIQEIERYWPGRIILADPALGGTRVRGVFSHRNLDEFFTALPTIMPVEVTRRAGDVILSRR